MSNEVNVISSNSPSSFLCGHVRKKKKKKKGGGREKFFYLKIIDTVKILMVCLRLRLRGLKLCLTLKKSV